MTRHGPSNAYRVRVTRERVVETAYTAFAVEVADARAGFRTVVVGSRIDAVFAPGDRSEDARRLLDEAVAGDAYAETAPLSERYDDLLEALGLGGVDADENGQLLLYDADLSVHAVRRLSGRPLGAGVPPEFERFRSAPDEPPLDHPHRRDNGRLQPTIPILSRGNINVTTAIRPGGERKDGRPTGRSRDIS